MLDAKEIKVGLGIDGFSLDINGDGYYDAYTDGFIISRFLMGYPAESIATAAEMQGATRSKQEMFDILQSKMQ